MIHRDLKAPEVRPGLCGVAPRGTTCMPTAQSPSYAWPIASEKAKASPFGVPGSVAPGAEPMVLSFKF